MTANPDKIKERLEVIATVHSINLVLEYQVVVLCSSSSKEDYQIPQYGTVL